MQIGKRYEVIDKLGQGGMGVVWCVYDRLTQTKVALKQVLIPENQLNFASKANTDNIDKLRLSLAQEFSLLATLRHPHVLSVLDFGFDENGYPFYTMILLEDGVDFKNYTYNVPYEKKIYLLTQILQALHYLHRRGILHRDLKPDNVLIDQSGQVKVMDFGLAKKIKQDDAQIGKDNEISGTIMYMAPEFFQGKAASVTSDLFAFGIMAYETLVGKYPYEYDRIDTLIMNLLTQTPNLVAVPDELEIWLARLLDQDPDLRYASAYDALQGLYVAQQLEIPPETKLIRDSFLQASEFIGRDSELNQLTDALKTLDNQSAFFLIGGESGVGKSRLSDELRIEALIRNALVIRGQGIEVGGLPFQLWRNIVRHMLLIVEVTDLQASILKDIVPDISSLLNREIADIPELTGKDYQNRIVLAIVDLFRNLPQPVVLLLEDLQWSGESLGVLQQILKISKQISRLMIVANYRDDEMPKLPEQLAEMTNIKLERLTSDEVSELSRVMLGDVGINQDVVKILHSQSEGNLFFLIETIRALAEISGDLESIGQRELPEAVFTGGMQDLTRRRLSKVDPEYTDIQNLAAIIGREINTKLLAYAYDDITVDAWIDNAVEYGVINIQDNDWRFAHDKLRETLIADIPNEDFPERHRTVAEAIEAIYPDDAGYHKALLNHWQQVGDLDKTYQYLLPVVKDMIKIKGLYTTAETYIHQMLDRLSTDDGRCIALWNWLASSYQNQGNYSASKTYSKQAQNLATTLNDLSGLAKSLHIQGIIASNQGEYQLANNLYQQVLELHQKSGDQTGIANVITSLGLVAIDQGNYEPASELCQQSLALFQQLGDQHGTANTLNNLGIIAMNQGKHLQANDFYQQCLALRQQLGDQVNIAKTLINLGVNYFMQDNYSRAGDLFRQSLKICQQLGDKRSTSQTLNNLAAIAFMQNDYTHATDLFQQSLAIFKQLSNRADMLRALNNLGLIAIRQEQYARANDLYQQALELHQKLGDQIGTARVLNTLGSIASQQGDSPVHWFNQSLVVASDIQSVPIILLNIIKFAEYLIGQKESERAAEYIGLVQNHPDQDENVRDGLAEIIPKLETTLSPDKLVAAIEYGKKLELDTVITELLDEFEI